MPLDDMDPCFVALVVLFLVMVGGLFLWLLPYLVLAAVLWLLVGEIRRL